MEDQRQDSYDDMSRDDLLAAADEQGVTVEGTGSDGYVTVDDLKGALRSRSSWGRQPEPDDDDTGAVDDDLNVDQDGSLIDPPVLPEWEQRMAAAQASADPDRIADTQEQYDDARREYVQRAQRRARERGDQ